MTAEPARPTASALASTPSALASTPSAVASTAIRLRVAQLLAVLLVATGALLLALRDTVGVAPGLALVALAVALLALVERMRIARRRAER